MSLSLNFSMRSWEIQLSIMTALVFRPVWITWSRPGESGFLARFLCFVLRAGRNTNRIASEVETAP